MQVTCSLKVGLVQRLAATWRGGLHSSPSAIVTTVGSCYGALEIVGVIIIIIKDRKLLILPTPPLFDAPAQGASLRMSG